MRDLPEFDLARHLETEADFAEYLRQVLEDRDSYELAAALGHIAKARGIDSRLN
jgi:probable addiction module antidote protein